MRRRLRIGLIACAGLALAALIPAEALGLRTFTRRFPPSPGPVLNTNGDVVVVANTLMRCPANDTRCAAALAGTAAGVALNNNSFNMVNWDVDTDPLTFNSSTAEFALPPGATVLFAGLYWGADTSIGTAAAAPAPAANPANRAALTPSACSQVRFRTPATVGTVSVTASVIDTLTAATTCPNAGAYQGFADVTALVQAGGGGTYGVANVQAGTGADRYAGWSLVVVVQDPAAPLRNLNVFDGYANVGSGAPATITVSGFLSPPVAGYTARLGMLAYEGDRGTTGDQVSLTATGPTSITTNPLTDATNPGNNFFNSSISRLGADVTTKNPNVVNQLGYDADIYNATGRFPPSATTASLTFSSTGDVYRPGMLSIVVDVFAPTVSPNFAKTVTDVNGGVVEPGDLLEYEAVVFNSGQDDAINSVLVDPIPAGAVYEPGTLAIVAGPNAGPKSDTAGNDQAEFDAANNRVVFRIGAGANATTGGELVRNQTIADATRIRFRVRVPLGTANATSIANQAAVAFVGETLNQSFNATSNLVTSTVVAAPVIVATKAVALQNDQGDPGPSPGDTLRYTVTLRNDGNETGAALRFVDTVDPNTTVVAGSVTTTQGSVTTGGPSSIDINVGALAFDPDGGGAGVGGVATIVFDVVIASPIPAGVTSVANQGTVSGTNVPATVTNDPATAAPDDPTVTAIVAKPIVTATKTAAFVATAPPAGPANDSIRYTIVIRNEGATDATGVVFTDTPDPNAPLDTPNTVTTTQGTITSGNGGADDSVAVSVGAIPAGGSVTITFDAQVASPIPAGVSTVANQGTVSGTNFPALFTDDPATAPAGDPTVTAVASDPLVIATKNDALFADADGNGVASPGDTLVYTVTLRNDGGGAATGVTFVDTPDPNAPLVAGSVTTSQGAVTSSTGSVGVDVGTIAGGGGTVNISFRVLVVAPLPAGVTSVANQGSVSGTNVPAIPTDDPDSATAGDATVTGLTANPIVSATKADAVFTDADSNGVPSPGDTLAYTVIIQNNGNGAATNVTFTDTPDANAPLVVGSVVTDGVAVTSGNTAGDTTVGVNVGTIPGGGGTVTISFRVLVVDPLPAGVTSVANQGTVSGTNVPALVTNDPDTPDGADATVTALTAAPAVSVAKSDALVIDADGNGVPSPGDTLAYSVTIQNTGNGAATGVTFADTPDPNAPLVVGSVVTSAGTVASGNTAGDTDVAVAVGTVPGGGGSVTISFRVQIVSPLPPGVTTIANQGTVSGANVPATATDDPATAAAADPTETSVTAAPSVSATKSVAVAIDTPLPGPDPGDTLVYTVTLRNNGNGAATGVVFADTPDANAPLITGSVVTSQGTISSNAGSVGVDVGTIPGGGGTVTISFRVDVVAVLPPGITSIANQGQVTGANIPPTPTDDPDTGAASDATVTALTAAPLVTTTKSVVIADDADSDGLPSPGDTLAYAVTIRNDGNAAATGVAFTDTPDPNASLVTPNTVVTSQGTVTGGNGAGDTTVTVTVGTIPGGGGQATVGFRVRIVDPLPAGVTTVQNQGVVTGGNFAAVVTDDPATAAAGDATVTAVTSAPLVVATKDDTAIVTDVAPPGSSPGDTIRYTVVITNTGNTAATGVVFTDAPIDPNAPLVAGSVTTSQGTVTLNAGTVAVTVGTLAGRGGSATITFDVQVVNPLPAGVSSVANQGTVTGANVPPTPTDDPATPAVGDTTVIALAANPVVTATKDDVSFVDNDGDLQPSPGDDVLYLVTITNSGNKDASGVVFTDIPDPNAPLRVGTVSATPGTVTQGNTAGDTAVSVNIGTVAGNGGTATVSFQVRIANPAPAGLSQVANQGTVTGGNITAVATNDPDTPTAGDATVTPVTAAPVVAATKSATVTTDLGAPGPTPGDTLTYTVIVQNNGNGAANAVSFADTPGPNTTLVTGSVVAAGATVTSGNTAGDTSVGVDFGAIPGGGASATVTFRVTIADPLPAGVTSVANQGTVSGANVPATPTDDPTTPAADDPTTTSVTAQPDITATKDDQLIVDADGNGVPSPGDQLLYTVALVNTGNGAATDIVFQDVPDPNAPIVVGSVNATQGTINAGNDPGNTTVFVTVGTLPGRGGAATISYRVTIRNPLPAGVLQVTNQGTLTGASIPATPTDDPDTATGPDETVTTLSAAPLLSATKTATVSGDVAPAGPSAGDTLTYTVTITNTGNQSATGVTFTDVPDANAPLVDNTVQVTPTGTVTSAVGAVGVNVGAIAGGGGQTTISFDVLIAASLPAGVNAVANQGIVSAANAASALTDDPGTAPAGDPTTTSLAASPVLSATKTVILLSDADASGGPTPGDTVLYRVLITNSGNQVAAGVAFTDIPGANTALEPGTVATSVGTVTTGNGATDTTVAVAIGNLAGLGTTAEVTFHVQIADAVPAGVIAVENQGTVVAGNAPALATDDPTTPTVGDPTALVITANPSLAVAKTATLLTDVAPAGPSPGDTLLYTITVANTGNQTASGVSISDVIDANLAVVAGSVQSSQGTVALAGSTISGTIGAIGGRGGSATITFEATVAASLPAGVTQVTNQAAVSGTNFPGVVSDDPSTATAGDPTVTPLTANPVVAVTKAVTLLVDTPAPGPDPGDTLLYTITVTNTGNQAASAITLSDVIDTNLGTPATIQTSQGTAAFAAGALTANIGTIPGGGGSATVTYQVTVDDPVPPGVTQVTNQAVVSGANFAATLSDDPGTAAAGDATVTAITANPEVSSTKTDTLVVDADGNGTPSPGDTLLYTIAIQNSGNQNATAAVVNDVADSNVQLVAGSVQVSQGSVTTGNGAGDTQVGVDIGLIPGGGGLATVTFRVVIRNPLPAGVTSVANTATVSGGNFPAVVTDDPDTPAPGDATVTAVLAAPVVSASKQVTVVVDSPTPGPDPGDTLLYTVTVTNTGNGAASGVTFNDVVDPNLGAPTDIQSSQGTVTLAGATLSGLLGTIPGGGGVATVTYRVAVDDPLPAGVTSVANQASISGTGFPAVLSDDPSTAAAGDPTVTPVTANPVVAVAKTASLLVDNAPAGPDPGDALLYTITVTNSGNQAAADVAINDLIDPNLGTPTNVQASQGTAAFAAGAVTAALGTIPGGGASATITFQVTIDDPLPAGVTNVANQATVSGSNFTVVSSDDPSTAAVGDATVTSVTASPVVAVTKQATVLVDTPTAGPDPGDTLRYTVTVTNSGNQAASGVTFSDVIDANLGTPANIQSSQGTVTLTGSTLSGSLGTIPGRGGTVTITFDVAVDDPLPAGVTSVANQASVSGANFPATVSDNPATPAAGDPTVTPLTANPVVAVAKTASLLVDNAPAGPDPGDTLLYTITVTNSGNQAAAGVAINDLIDTNLGTPTALQTSQGTVAFAAGAVTATLGTIPGAGATATITYQVTIDDPLPAGVTQVTNQASASGANFAAVVSDDPSTAPTGDATVVNVTAAPAVDVIKSDALVVDADANGTPSPGDTLLYTITVTNTGNQAASGVTFSDVVDPNLTVIVASIQASQGTASLTGTTLSGTLGTIPGRGGSVTVTLQAVVVNPLPAGVTQVVNQAAVAGGNFPGVASDDPATAATGDATVTQLTANPVVGAVKTALVVSDVGDPGPSPGDTLRFAITVTNTGNQAASAVTLSDVIDTNLGTPANIQASQGAAGLTGATLTAALGTIPGGGASATVTYEVTIDDPVPVGVTSVANQAAVSGGNFPATLSDDPATGPVGDPTVIAITAAPAVASTKVATLVVDADGNATPSPGDTLLYTITVTNSGNQAATAAVLSDVTDPNVQLANGTAQVSQGAITSGNTAGDTTVGADIGVLPGRGGTAVTTFRVVVRNPLPAGVVSVANAALVSGGNFPAVVSDDPSTPAVGDPTTTAITASPALQASKDATVVVDADNDGFASPGDTLLYTVSIRNAGNQAATAMTFADTIGANLTLVPGSIQTTGTVTAGASGGPAVGVAFGTVPGGGTTVAVSFRVTLANPIAAAVVTVENQGRVNGGNFAEVVTDDPLTVAAPDPTVTAIRALPLLRATKDDVVLVDADGNGAPSPGDRLLYTVVIQNIGNREATALRFADTPDPNAPLVAGSVTTSRGVVTGGNGAGDTAVAVDIGNVPGGGADARISFAVQIRNPAPLGVATVSNQGSVSGTNVPTQATDDPRSAAGSDATVTSLAVAPRLSATKRDAVAVDVDGNGVASPGDEVAYTVTIRNDGNIAVDPITFTDTPDAASPVIVGSVTTTLGTVTSGNADGQTTVGVALGQLAGGGGVATITYRTRIANPVPANVVELRNQGRVDAPGVTLVTDDPDTAAAGDATVTPLSAASSITLVKSAALAVDSDRNRVTGPGDTVRYAIVLANGGNKVADGLRITDVLDPNVAIVPGSVTTTRGAVVGGNAAGERTVTVDVGALAPAEAATVSFSVTISKPFPAGATQIANQASVAGSNVPSIASDDPSTAQPGDATVTRVSTGTFGVRVTGPSRIPGGRIGVFGIRVRNGCNTASGGVVVRVFLPPGTSMARIPRGARLRNGVLTWRIPQLTPGQVRNLGLRIRVDRTASGVRRIRVVVDGTDCGSGARTKVIRVLRVAGGVNVPRPTG